MKTPKYEVASRNDDLDFYDGGFFRNGAKAFEPVVLRALSK